MRKTIVMGAAMAMTMAVSTQAFAADVYRGDAGAAGFKDGPAPVQSWTGFYFGGHAGGAWSDVDARVNYIGSLSPVTPDRSTGVIGGGQLGYNLQSGNIVFGLEADLGGAGLSGSARTTVGTPYDYKHSGGFYGDITGRVGLTSGQALFYAKGGAAFLNSEYQFKYIGNPQYDSSGGDTSWGWTIGGGIEYMLNSNWSAKIEYQHFDFGRTDIKINNVNYLAEFNTTADAVTFGANYHVGRGYEPLK